jgi:chromosome segregation ATPase
MDKARKEAEEYATHLEEELSTSKTSISEAAEELRAREEQAARQEAALDAAGKDGEDLRAKLQAMERELDESRSRAERSKREAEEYATHLEGEVESSKASTAEASESIRSLEEEVASLTTEIEDLRIMIDRNKQEADEYATHLEEQVESSKASVVEAAEELRAREEQALRLEDELAQTSSVLHKLRDELERAFFEVERLTMEKNRIAEEASALKVSLRDLTEAHQKLLEQSALKDDELKGILHEISVHPSTKSSGLQEVILNRQESLSPKGTDGTGHMIQKEKKKALRAARPNLTSAAQSLSMEHNEESENFEPEPKTLPAILRDQMRIKDDVIQNLREKLKEVSTTFDDFKMSAERSRTESADYATHLEEEIEMSKANIAEAVKSMQGLEEEVVKKDTLLSEESRERENYARKLNDLEFICRQRDEKIIDLEREIEKATWSSTKTRKEAEDYATHLEKENEISKVIIFLPRKFLPLLLCFFGCVLIFT